MAHQKPENQTDLVSLIADLKEDETLAMIRQLLDEGSSPHDILNLCYLGMNEVGVRFQNETYAIAGLIMAGDIMREVGEILFPLLERRHISEKRGRIVLGTVAGDIHDLGKDIFKTLLNTHGYSVHDLGVDVPPARFLSAIYEFRPDIVGLSCLISSTVQVMSETISFLRKTVEKEMAPKAYIIGGHVDQLVFEACQADYWANDANQGIKICNHVMGVS